MEWTRSNRLLTLVSSAAALFALSCADPGTAPNVVERSLDNSSRGSVVAVPGLGVQFPGKIRLCKASESVSPPAATFTFNVSVDAGAVTNPTVDLGACINIVDDLTEPNSHTATVSEQDLDDWVLDSIVVEYGSGGCGIGAAAEDGTTATASSNNDCGQRITFWNSYDPDITTGCTYTKGFYKNHSDDVAQKISDLGGTIAIGSTGETLNAAQAQAILNATPGKPGAITFTSNNLLNLAQQLITAILNGGESGPSSVQTAISNANAGFTLAADKTSLTTALDAGAIGALIGPLDNFNNGNVEGFPHCDD